MLEVKDLKQRPVVAQPWGSELVNPDATEGADEVAVAWACDGGK